VFIFFLVFSFLRFWQEDSTQEVQFGEWPASCVVDGVLWPNFHCFSRIFEAKSAHVCQLLLDTRYLAVFPVVLRPCCRKHRSCRSLELSTWSSRTREPLLSDCASRPRSAFSGRAWQRLGSTASDLLLGASGGSTCPTRTATLAKSASLLHYQRLFLGCFLPLCLCIPLISPV